MEKLNYNIEENEGLKQLTSEDYNYVYNRNLNTIVRWGKDKSDNPVWAPYGPEYVTIDMEGISMELFTIIVDILNANRTITTFNLLGLVEPCDDPRLWYCFSKGIIPTCNINLENEEEAGFFSAYVDNKGIVRPVSSYSEGIDIMTVNNMYRDIWQSPIFKKYRWQKLQEKA